ncbi:hypothetical protein [Mucilaginibacter rubeus]|nr:hypothetical protein [Mucilaginibacter rubeus]
MGAINLDYQVIENTSALRNMIKAVKMDLLQQQSAMHGDAPVKTAK